MNDWRRAVSLLVATLVCAGAHAQGLNAEAMALFGGRYATDCARAEAPTVVVEPSRMRIEQGPQRMTVGNLQAAFSYFGQSAPPDFRVALLGQVQGRHEVVALVSADALGQVMALDGDRTVMANLGAMGRLKFRHCNEAANNQARAARQADQQAQAAAQTQVAPGSATHPSQLVRDPRFKPAYLRALGPLARTPWLAEMHGPASDLSRARIGGVDYTVAAFCKPRDCGEHNAVLLYDAAQGRVFGTVHQAGQQQSIGAPPGALLIELNAIWRREWRQGR